MPPQNTLAGKVLVGITAVVIVGGIAAGVIVPLTMASLKAEEDNAKMTSMYLISHDHLLVLIVVFCL